MKKLFIYTIACLFAIVSQAQETKHPDSAYLERCRNICESLRETGREFRAKIKKRDCNEIDSYVNDYIEDYKNAVTDKDKTRLMRMIAIGLCPKIIDFYEKIVLSDTSAYIRGQAIQYIGGIGAESKIPFLSDYYQRPNLSTYEKVSIGITFIALELDDYGEKILNENCFDTAKQIRQECDFCYQALGNESSIKYFRYLNKILGGMYYIWDLVNVGDKETALPAIREYMKTSNPGRKVALRMLETIGDEKSIEIIQSVLNDPNIEIKEEARKTLKKIKTDE